MGALDRCLTRMRSLIALRPIEKAYVLGGTLLLVALAGVSLPFDDARFLSIGWVGGLVLTLALACEAYLLIARVADATWAKWLMVPVLVMGGALAIGESRSEEHTSELQSLMRISYAVFCLKKKKRSIRHTGARTN